MAIDHSNNRGQAALEYLVNYGWAILIIVIVLAVLTFEFGGFSTGTFASQTCVAQVGITCQGPVMNTSGYVAANFTSFQTPYSVTAVACTTNKPASANLINFTSIAPTLVYTNPTRIAFKCPIQVPIGANITLGSSFSGYIWFKYNTQAANNIISEVATVSVRASTTSGLGSSGYAAPVALDSYTSSSTGTLSITTTQANEVIVVATTGGGTGSCCGAVTVDGNAMSEVTWSQQNQYGGYYNAVAVYTYTAPTPGAHSISVTETYFQSGAYNNYAASFTNVQTSGDSALASDTGSNPPAGYGYSTVSGNSIVFMAVNYETCNPTTPSISWTTYVGQPTPHTLSKLSVNNPCWYGFDTGDMYLVSPSANTLTAVMQSSYNCYCAATYVGVDLPES